MWGAGFATGIGVGFVLGLVVGRLGVKQKPWSELTGKDKKARKISIVVGYPVDRDRFQTGAVFFHVCLLGVRVVLPVRHVRVAQ